MNDKHTNNSALIIVWSPIFFLLIILIYLLISCSYMPQEEESDFVESVMWKSYSHYPNFSMDHCEWDDRVKIY